MLRNDLTFFSAWSEQDHVYLHWGIGEIEGFVWRYVVESHSPVITEVEIEMILEAFETTQKLQAPVPRYTQ